MAVQPISFRPNKEDQRILANSGMSPTDTLRQGLRLLNHEQWLERFHEEAKSQRDFDPNAEAEDW